MTLVIDANCLIQIIPKISKYHWIWQYYLQGKFQLAVSTDILNEIEEVYSRWTPQPIVKNILKAIVNHPNTLFIAPSYFWNFIHQDQDDNKYVDCAIAANADFIVTNDAHFKNLKKIGFPKVRVLSTSQLKRSMFN
jgi:uncharacterized protein